MSADRDDVAARLLSEAVQASGLSQAELARRAGMPGSVLSAYVRGRRQPSVAALARIHAAAGLELELAPAAEGAEVEHAGRVLAQVLDLAEQLPYRARREMAYPPLIRLAA
jgi:transcriptional regulator with XRE-family HTH domain